MEKEFISPARLHRDAFMLARRIYDSGFRPDTVIVLWRGGTPVGIVIHEFLLFHGVQTYHTVVKAESYTGIEQRIEPRIEHLDFLLRRISKGSRVLVVDDIFDTGCTLKALLDRLGVCSCEIRTATLYCRAGNNRTDIAPDYFLRKTDRWIVFPHELMDLSPEEIGRKEPYVGDLLA